MYIHTYIHLANTKGPGKHLQHKRLQTTRSMRYAYLHLDGERCVVWIALISSQRTSETCVFCSVGVLLGHEISNHNK